MNNKQNSERKITLALFKSEEFKKSLLSYAWVLTSMCLAYGFADTLVHMYSTEFSSLSLNIKEAVTSILRIGLFSILISHKNINLILLMQAIGLFLAINQPEQTLTVGLLTQLTMVANFVVKYSYLTAKAFLKATERFEANDELKLKKPFIFNCAGNVLMILVTVMFVLMGRAFIGILSFIFLLN